MAMEFPWGRGNQVEKSRKSQQMVGGGGGGSEGVRHPGMENVGGGINLGKNPSVGGMKIFWNLSH